MEHPSPEPQTAQPSTLDAVTSQPHSSGSDIQLSPPSSRTPVLGPKSQQNIWQRLLVSLFENITDNLQESQTEPTAQGIRTTELAPSNQTSNATVGGAGSDPSSMVKVVNQKRTQNQNPGMDLQLKQVLTDV